MNHGCSGGLSQLSLKFIKRPLPLSIELKTSSSFIFPTAVSTCLAFLTGRIPPGLISAKCTRGKRAQYCCMNCSVLGYPKIRYFCQEMSKDTDCCLGARIKGKTFLFIEIKFLLFNFLFFFKICHYFSTHHC